MYYAHEIDIIIFKINISIFIDVIKIDIIIFRIKKGFPGSSAGKESACNAGDLGSIPGLGRSPGEGKGYPLQYACLENSMDGGAWQATVHRVSKSRTQLSNFHFHFLFSIRNQLKITD